MPGIGLTTGLPDWLTGNDIAVGESVMPREDLNESLALSSGAVFVTFFTARKTETTTQVRIQSGSVATNTATLVRMGLYTVTTAGAGTQVAATENDPTVLSITNTVYTRSWSAPVAKVAGQRYAFALLVVGTGAGSAYGRRIQSMESLTTPRLSLGIGGQADLPVSFAASMTQSLYRIYAAVLP